MLVCVCELFLPGEFAACHCSTKVTCEYGLLGCDCRLPWCFAVTLPVLPLYLLGLRL